MTLRLAILGCGGIAATHLQSLKELSDFNVSYICDIDEEKANDLAINSPGSQIENSMDMIITNKDIEKLARMALIDPCTPENPKKVSLDDMKLMYQHSLEGKLF